MSALLIGLLGAFSMRYRGGFISSSIETWIDNNIKNKVLSRVLKTLTFGKLVNAVIWALFVGYLFAGKYSEGVYTLTASASVVIFYSFIMMLRWSAPAWGDYIGAAGGWRTTDLHDVEYIDNLIKGLQSKPYLWGIAGLSIRCAEWGFMLGAPLALVVGFDALYLCLVGLLAGPYMFVLSFTLKKFIPTYTIWEIFEASLGVALFIVTYSVS